MEPENVSDPRIDIVASAILEGLKRSSDESSFISGPEFSYALVSFDGDFRLRDLALYVLTELDRVPVFRV